MSWATRKDSAGHMWPAGRRLATPGLRGASCTEPMMYKRTKSKLQHVRLKVSMLPSILELLE